MPPTPQEAAAFLERADFVWHQRFELAPGVWTPGSNDIGWLLDAAGVPADLRGASVLDVGTTNAGAAFLLERRGAGRVVAVDIFAPDWFGVAALTELLGSRVEYLRASVYELPERLDERFDVVLFLGVLYHLRHPLLALDCLRAVTGGQAVVESAVCDGELGRRQRGRPLARFYRGAELADDPSNWFSPTVAGLHAWCGSCGFQVEPLGAWPARRPARAMARLRPTPGAPEFARISYERPLRATLAERP